MRFGSDTSRWFRQHMLRPFLAQYLKDGAPAADVAPVTAFETGTNEWRRFDRWPISCEAGCAHFTKALYLLPDNKVGFEAPSGGRGLHRVCLGSRAPVPFRARPIQQVGYAPAPDLADMVDG